MRSMLMLLPKGRGKGNKKEQWEDKSVGAPAPNGFPDHNGTMPGNAVRCSTIRNSQYFANCRMKELSRLFTVCMAWSSYHTGPRTFRGRKRESFPRAGCGKSASPVR